MTHASVRARSSRCRSVVRLSVGIEDATTCSPTSRRRCRRSSGGAGWASVRSSLSICCAPPARGIASGSQESAHSASRRVLPRAGGASASRRCARRINRACSARGSRFGSPDPVVSACRRSFRVPEVADGWPYSREGWQFFEGRGDPANGTIGGMTSSARRVVDLSHPIRAGSSPTRASPRRRSRRTSPARTRARLRPGHRVRDRPHHDGRQHRHLPRQPVPPLRRRRRPRGPRPRRARRPAAPRSPTAGADGRGIAAEAFSDRDLARHGGAAAHRLGPALRRARVRAGAPFLTEAGAQYLVDAGVALVGIDSLNIDDTESGGERPGALASCSPPASTSSSTSPASTRCPRAAPASPPCRPRSRLRHLPGAGVRRGAGR